VFPYESANKQNECEVLLKIARLKLQAINDPEQLTKLDSLETLAMIDLDEVRQILGMKKCTPPAKSSLLTWVLVIWFAAMFLLIYSQTNEIESLKSKIYKLEEKCGEQ